MDDIGETAHAIRRDTRVIDEQLLAILSLMADLEAEFDGPDFVGCRARIAIAMQRTEAIRARVEHDPPGPAGVQPTPTFAR